MHSIIGAPPPIQYLSTTSLAAYLLSISFVSVGRLPTSKRRAALFDVLRRLLNAAASTVGPHHTQTMTLTLSTAATETR